MSLIKQARFYAFSEAKTVQTVEKDLADIFDGYLNDEDEHEGLLFDYDSTAEQQVGFVPLYDGHCQSATDEVVYHTFRGNWLVFSVLQRQKKIDQSQLRKEVEKRARQVYESTGEELNRKLERELTEEVRRELMVKNATMKYRRANVYISQKDALVCINNGGQPFCETILAFLRTAIGSLPIHPYPDVDQADNIDLRALSAFQELEKELYDDNQRRVTVEDWLKAEQREEGKVTMRNAPDEVLESLIENRYVPVKYEVQTRSHQSVPVDFDYEDRKLTKIKVNEFADDMVPEDYDDKVAAYWADLDISIGIIDVLVETLKCIGSDIDDEGELGL